MAKFNPVVTTSLSVGLATGVYGISFGALSVTAGLDIWQTQVLSLLMFSGGSQFAFVGVLAGAGLGGPAVGAAVVSAWLLGIRNGFYAVQLSPILAKVGLAKIIPALLTIDESTAVSSAQSQLSDKRRGFWLTGIAVFVFWNLMTLLGAVLGDAMGDPTAWGLDAAAAAAFLGLIWPRLRERQAAAVAALAILIAVLATPFLPAGLPILISGSVAVLVGGLDIFKGGRK